MALFTAQDLADYLQLPVVEERTAVMVERVVAGWLADEGLTYAAGDPDKGIPAAPVPAQVFSWAVELGALVYENPTSMTSDTTADQTQSWWRGQRDAILLKVRAYARRLGVAPPVVSTTVATPLGSFPAPWPAYPDPAERWDGGEDRAAGAEHPAWWLR